MTSVLTVAGITAALLAITYVCAASAARKVDHALYPF